MKNSEIFDLVTQQGPQLVMVVDGHLSKFGETCFDEHMIGRVLNVGKMYEGTEDEHYYFDVDEKQFRGINEPYMQCNWYDKESNPTLNYIEAEWAPKNGVERIYLMPDDTDFKVIKKIPKERLQDVFTRDEVLELARSAYKAGRDNGEGKSELNINDWVEQNLLLRYNELK